MTASAPAGDGPTDIDWLRRRLIEHAPQQAAQAPAGRAAVAMVLRALRDDWEMLFIKRAEHPDDPWSGHMALPGGRLDPGDPSPLAAAQRETVEEVGVDLQRSGRHLGQLDDVTPSRASRSLVITPYVFELVERVAPTPDAREVDEIHWVRASQLRDPQIASTCVWQHDGTRYDLPCFRVHGRVIWGLTYRMLMSLFAALRWPLPLNGRD